MCLVVGSVSMMVDRRIASWDAVAQRSIAA